VSGQSAGKCEGHHVRCSCCCCRKEQSGWSWLVCSLQSAVCPDFGCTAATRLPIHVRGLSLNYVQGQRYSDVTVPDAVCDRQALCHGLTHLVHGERPARRRVPVRSHSPQLPLSTALTYWGVTSIASRVHWMGVQSKFCCTCVGVQLGRCEFVYYVPYTAVHNLPCPPLI
jgi:hypothetical protein